MALGTIYACRMPNGGPFIYVGQTRKRVDLRWNDHAKGKTRFSRFLQMFSDPTFFEWGVIEEVDENDLNACEVSWIARLNTAFPHGLNMTEGGHMGRRSPETRKRMSEARKALWANKDFREKTVAALAKSWENEGRRLVASANAIRQMAKPEAREAISKANTGRMRSDETRALLSAASKSRWSDPEYKDRHIMRITGRKDSEATKAKKAEANRIASLRPEVKKRRSDGVRRHWAEVRRKGDVWT